MESKYLKRLSIKWIKIRRQVARLVSISAEKQLDDLLLYYLYTERPELTPSDFANRMQAIGEKIKLSIRYVDKDDERLGKLLDYLQKEGYIAPARKGSGMEITTKGEMFTGFVWNKLYKWVVQGVLVILAAAFLTFIFSFNGDKKSKEVTPPITHQSPLK